MSTIKTSRIAVSFTCIIPDFLNRAKLPFYSVAFVTKAIHKVQETRMPGCFNEEFIRFSLEIFSLACFMKYLCS